MSECQGCGDETNVLYLHSQCHPEAPTWTKLRIENGVAVQAIVECCECEKTIMELFLVAAGSRN